MKKAQMIELNKRQYEILTFMANTGAQLALWNDAINRDVDIMPLVEAELCIINGADIVQIAPHAREMFRDAGLRRIN
jgi:hypothetical protein